MAKKRKSPPWRLRGSRARRRLRSDSQLQGRHLRLVGSLLVGGLLVGSLLVGGLLVGGLLVRQRQALRVRLRQRFALRLRAGSGAGWARAARGRLWGRHRRQQEACTVCNIKPSNPISLCRTTLHRRLLTPLTLPPQLHRGLSMALGRPTPGARGAQVARQAINQAAQQGGGA